MQEVSSSKRPDWYWGPFKLLFSWYRGSFPKVKRPGFEANHAPLYGAEINSLWCCRVQLKCDGTRWRAGGEAKGKLANGVCSQYSSHYLGTRCIQHYYRWWAHHGCQLSTELTPLPIKMDSSVWPKDEIWFLRVCHHISDAVYLLFLPCREQGRLCLFYLDWKKVRGKFKASVILLLEEPLAFLRMLDWTSQSAWTWWPTETWQCWKSISGFPSLRLTAV